MNVASENEIKSFSESKKVATLAFSGMCQQHLGLNLLIRASLVAQMVKNPPAMQETWVQSLGQEDTLEKKMATHSSIDAWRIPWTEDTGRIWSMRSQKFGHD